MKESRDPSCQCSLKVTFYSFAKIYSCLICLVASQFVQVLTMTSSLGNLSSEFFIGDKQLIKCTKHFEPPEDKNCICHLDTSIAGEERRAFNMCLGRQMKKHKLPAFFAEISTENPMFFGVLNTIDNYFYDPCYSFVLTNSSGACVNVAACKQSIIKSEGSSTVKSGSLGLHASLSEEISYSKSDKTLIVHHKAVSNGDETHSATINIKCNPLVHHGDEVMKVDRQHPPSSQHVNLLIESECVCRPGSCLTPHPDHHSLSVGTLLIITFLIVVAVYLVVGTLYRYSVAGGGGGVELLPHHHFWCSHLPGLIHDGCLFTFSPCVPGGRALSGYGGEYQPVAQSDTGDYPPAVTRCATGSGTGYRAVT